MQTSMVFLNRFLRASAGHTGWTREDVRKPAVVTPRQEGIPIVVPTATVDTASVERVCELLSQHMAQGVCIAEILAAGAQPGLRVVFENATFRQVGGLPALAGDRTIAQFAVHLSERLGAAGGKTCVITASSGIVFQVQACTASTPGRVVIVCDPVRPSARERELISTVAHEMRNGMSALCGAVEVLGASATEGARSSRALEIARRQLEDLRRFVDDLLSVGQESKREFEITRAPVRVRDLVLNTVETHGGEAERRGIRLLVQPPAGDLIVSGDSGRLRQVLSNLFLNACKFTPPDGLITVGAVLSDGQIRISVTDTGSGIEPDQVTSIFEPFGQEHYADDQSRNGLGIGLCVARRLVQLHGGALAVKSDGRNRGSEFTVTLPAA